MEIIYKKGLTLGDFISAAYQVWGADRAEKMVQWAIQTGLVLLPAKPYLLFSATEGWAI